MQNSLVATACSLLITFKSLNYCTTLKVVIRSCNPLAEMHLYKMIIELVRH